MKLLIISVIINIFIYPSSSNTQDESGKLNHDGKDVQLFQRLFKVKRQEHKNAVKTIMEYENYEKQYKMIDIIATKSFSVLQDCQIRLREAGYIPGMDFPQDDNIKDELSLLIENTAFLGEILLHIPAITHKILHKYKDKTLFFTWGIIFASQASFVDRNTKKLIYLITQELGLAEVDANYENPYDVNAVDTNEPNLKPTKTREKKIFQKGPKLSRNEL